MHSVMGSLAFVAAARAAWLAIKDRNDVSGRRRLFLPLKNNLAGDTDGLAYQLVDAGNEQFYVSWEAGVVTTTAEEAMKPLKGEEDMSTELGEAREWLRSILAQEPKEACEILKQAEKDGITKATLRRAKKDLKVSSSKTGLAGGWTWCLPRWKQTADEGAQDEGAQA